MQVRLSPVGALIPKCFLAVAALGAISATATFGQLAAPSPGEAPSTRPAISDPYLGSESDSSGLQTIEFAGASAKTAAIPPWELPESPPVQPEAANRAGDPNLSPGTDPDQPQATKPARFAPAARAPLFSKYIEPGQTTLPLAGFRQKMLFGLDQIVSPYFLVAVASSAGYEQAVNGSPNYGTNASAFGQRIGAAAATNAAESIFTDGFMPAVFRQDPRYYIRGKSHKFLARGAYAISRVFVTYSDSGNEVPNFSLFAGHATTAILQNAYYPSLNQGVSETAKSFATSFGGTALSNAIREFLPDVLRRVHLE